MYYILTSLTIHDVTYLQYAVLLLTNISYHRLHHNTMHKIGRNYDKIV